jgi:antitoxin component of MazEF toxin-antitoxin module
MSTKTSRTFIGKVKKRAIGLETLLRISQHGDGAYLFLPKDVVDVFHLIPGDRVQVKLVASYRLLSAIEEEKAEATRQEKIEPTLVIPRQRRRRRKTDLDSHIEAQESIEKEDEGILSEEENMGEGEL